jgi:hypothetical protein
MVQWLHCWQHLLPPVLTVSQLWEFLCGCSSSVNILMLHAERSPAHLAFCQLPVMLAPTILSFSWQNSWLKHKTNWLSVTGMEPVRWLCTLQLFSVPKSPVQLSVGFTQLVCCCRSHWTSPVCQQMRTRAVWSWTTRGLSGTLVRPAPVGACLQRTLATTIGLSSRWGGPAVPH